jgi:ABC-type transport system involved in multi-copper enzyme maturation permease subunit
LREFFGADFQTFNRSRTNVICSFTRPDRCLVPALGGDAMRPALTLARFVVLEARRTGLPLSVICALGIGMGLAGFLSRLALTESVTLQTGVLASFFRVTAVLMTAALVVTSVVRELNDKGTDLLLSLPISRTTYYLGKLAGFAACGAILAGIFSAVMLFWCPPGAVAVWCLSLTLEVSLMAVVSLFFVMTIGDVVPALAAVAGCYFLSRVMASFQSIAMSPLADQPNSLQQLAASGIDLVALLLPPLDSATQTVWLLYAPPSAVEFLHLAGMLVVYGTLVTAAGLFDFHRRNL